MNEYLVLFYDQNAPSTERAMLVEAENIADAEALWKARIPHDPRFVPYHRMMAVERVSAVRRLETPDAITR